MAGSAPTGPSCAGPAGRGTTLPRSPRRFTGRCSGSSSAGASSTPTKPRPCSSGPTLGSRSIPASEPGRPASAGARPCATTPDAVATGLRPRTPGFGALWAACCLQDVGNRPLPLLGRAARQSRRTARPLLEPQPLSLAGSHGSARLEGTKEIPIPFVHRGHRFDETFRGSGWEDSDWCQQFVAADRAAMFIQSNRCRLVHLNRDEESEGCPLAAQPATLLLQVAEVSQRAMTTPSTWSMFVEANKCSAFRRRPLVEPSDRVYGRH
jgi:hypothetical protein